jgi:hypothetical protein
MNEGLDFLGFMVFSILLLELTIPTLAHLMKEYLKD